MILGITLYFFCVKVVLLGDAFVMAFICPYVPKQGHTITVTEPLGGAFKRTEWTTCFFVIFLLPLCYEHCQHVRGW